MKNIFEQWKRVTLSEAQTAQIQNLPVQEISNLVDLLLGEDSPLEVTEKLAGRHVKVSITADGDIMGLTKKKNEPFKLPKSIAEPLEPLATGEEREFSFEILVPHNRPDYVHYMIDKTVYADVSGNLTQAEAQSLSNMDYKFLTKKDLSRNSFDLTPEQESELEQIQTKLGGKLKRKEKQAIASQIASILMSPGVQGIFGGAMEGLFVTGGSKDFKIPSPSYADVQRIQSPIYAVWSGRGGISKTDLKRRFVYGGYSDAIVRDVVKYLYSVLRGYPSGYKSFFSPDEAEEILEMISDPQQRLAAYKVMNGRINDRANWHVF